MDGRQMRKSAMLLFALMATSCAAPNPGMDLRAVYADIAPQGLLHVGDVLTVNASAGSLPITGITVTNRRTGASQPITSGAVLNASTWS